ncbi:MAG: hypothetical protein ACJA0S_000452 [Rickettsiales bacterium]|jgi:hypothetical protein
MRESLVINDRNIMVKKWTIGIVNYYSSVYIRWQLKILHEFNTQKDFQVVIIDNSNDSLESFNLNKISNQYPNVTIVSRSYSCKSSEGASMQHGNGLDIALQHAKLSKSKLFLTLDPDCFLLQSNFLNIFENKISNGLNVFGTEYSESKKKAIKDDPNFPCAFACAYDLDVMGFDFSFTPISNNPEKVVLAGQDVGYKIREQFSKKPYGSFKRKKMVEPIIFQSTHFAKNFEYYFFEENLIAVHFNKTSRNFSGKGNNKFYSKLFLVVIFKTLIWNFIRCRAAKKCYDFLNKSAAT